MHQSTIGKKGNERLSVILNYDENGPQLSYRNYSIDVEGCANLLVPIQQKNKVIKYLRDKYDSQFLKEFCENEDSNKHTDESLKNILKTRTNFIKDLNKKFSKIVEKDYNEYILNNAEIFI